MAAELVSCLTASINMSRLNAPFEFGYVIISRLESRLLLAIVRIIINFSRFFANTG